MTIVNTIVHRRLRNHHENPPFQLEINVKKIMRHPTESSVNVDYWEHFSRAKFLRARCRSLVAHIFELVN